MVHQSFVRVAALLLAGLVGSSALAAVINPSGDMATDTAAIKAACQAAGSGSVVELGEGTFLLDPGTGITLSNGATLKGQGWTKTIIKQNVSSCNRAFKLSGGSKIEGVTLTGFKGNYRGLAVYAENGSVSWCCISNNTSTATDAGNAAGVGICILKGSVDHCLVANNVVDASSCTYGAGIGALLGSSDGSKVGPITIDSCLVYGNVNNGTTGGGGIAFAKWTGAVTIRNCTIADNTSVKGAGGIYCVDSGAGGKLTLVNDIAASNKVGSDELNVSITADSLDTTGSLNCLITGTATGTSPYKDASIVSALSANGFISSSPGFVNASKCDYHLDSASPAVEAGVTYTGIGKDLDGVDFADPPSVGCYQGEAGVSMPTFSPASGTTYSTSLDVTLSCKTDGATIRYTVDGSEPTSSSLKYTAPISVTGTGTTTIKACAFKAGLAQSKVATASYSYAAPTPPAFGNVTVSSGAKTADLIGTLSSIGNNGATACDVYLSYGLASGSLGAETKIASGIAAGVSFKSKFEGLSELTSYKYRLRAVNNAAEVKSTTYDGTFTTVSATAGLEPVKGDPTATWNLIQNAINAGGQVYLAKGTFEIDQPIVINNGASLAGVESVKREEVIVKQVTAAQNVIRIIGSAGTVVSHLTITGGKDVASGVSMDSGTIEDCFITGILTQNNNYDGAGVNMAGGTVRGCTITKCASQDSGSYSREGEAIYMTAGLVENCIITDNGVASGGGQKAECPGGAVCIKGGTLRGCLIARNRNKNTASGVGIVGDSKTGSVPKCVIENCTIAGNMQNDAAANAYGVAVFYNSYWSNPKVLSHNVVFRNNIVWGNMSFDGTTEVNCDFTLLNQSSSIVDNNDSRPAIAFGNKNICTDPIFADAKAGDYHVDVSDCTNGGSNQDWMSGAFDLDGHARIIFGVVDMGCYERDKMGCSVRVEAELGKTDKVNVTLTAENRGGTLESPHWTITRQQDLHQIYKTGASVELTLETGTWDVRFQGVADGSPVDKKLVAAVDVAASFVYANSANAAGVYPFSSKETGTPDVNEAFELLGKGGTLYVAAGKDYVMKRRFNMTDSTGVRVVSLEGPEKTVIRLDDVADFKDTHYYGLYLSSSKAYVEGITFVAGRKGAYYTGNNYWTYGFAKVEKDGAMITNCVFRDFVSSTVGAGSGGVSGLYQTAGTVADCSFTAIDSYSAGGAIRNGPLINISGGIADRLRIDGCFMAADNGLAAGGSGDVVGVYGSGELRNSLIVNCYSNHGDPVYVAGTIINCTIVGNRNTQSRVFSTSTYGGVTTTNYYNHVGGVRVNGGKLRNSIVFDNRSIYAGSVSNIYNTAGVDGITYTMVNDRIGDSKFVEGTHNIATVVSLETVFKDPVGNDYRLSASAPAIDQAEEMAWMASTLDLAGNPRMVGRAPDMGCYEYVSAVPFGITVFIQ